MSGRTWRAALLAISALMVCSSLVRPQVNIPATEAVGPAPTVPGTGLNGAWYFNPDDSTRAIPDLNTAQGIILSEDPLARFTATAMHWTGGDTTPVDQFLTAFFFGKDGKTLKPPRTDQIQSSIFDMTGYIRIGAADLDTTFGINSDDGSLLLIGQNAIEVVRNDGTHGTQLRTGEAIFEAPGLYPIEVIYFNQDFTNNGMQHQGGAAFDFVGTLGPGGLVDSQVLYPAIP